MDSVSINSLPMDPINPGVALQSDWDAGFWVQGVISWDCSGCSVSNGRALGTVPSLQK